MLAASFVLSVLASSASANEIDKDSESRLNDLVERIKSHPAQFVDELRSSEFAALAPVFNSTTLKKSPTAGEGLPLVFLHGMGDSCFNNGMASLTEDAGNYKGVYSVCIPTGETRLEDTINGNNSSPSLLLVESHPPLPLPLAVRLPLEHGCQCRCLC
jgi:hypothetical protein